MQKKYNRFKKLKIKIIKKRKEKKKQKKKEKKGGGYSTELEKSNVEAEVYNHNRN